MPISASFLRCARVASGVTAYLSSIDPVTFDQRQRDHLPDFLPGGHRHPTQAGIIDNVRAVMVCSRGNNASNIGLLSHPSQERLPCRFIKRATSASATRRLAPASPCWSPPVGA